MRIDENNIKISLNCGTITGSLCNNLTAMVASLFTAGEFDSKRFGVANRKIFYNKLVDGDATACQTAIRLIEFNFFRSDLTPELIKEAISEVDYVWLKKNCFKSMYTASSMYYFINDLI